MKKLGNLRCRDCGVLLGKEPHTLWCQSGLAAKERKVEVRRDAALSFTLGPVLYVLVDPGPLKTYAKAATRPATPPPQPPIRRRKP